MDRALVDRIARSVLYEGYLLYPYRPSSLKNAKRFAFGTLYPRKWVTAKGGSDRSDFQTEVLFVGPAATRVSVVGRFLDGDCEGEIEFETPISEPQTTTAGFAALSFA